MELPCRFARTGLLGGRSGLLARGSPPPSRLPEVLVGLQWRLLDGGSPLTVARQLRLRTGFPWCPGEILAFWVGLVGAGQGQVTGLARDGHREVETVRHEGELDVGG